jgi:hypothetical protein
MNTLTVAKKTWLKLMIAWKRELRPELDGKQAFPPV